MSDKPQAEQAGQAPAKSKKMLLIVVAVVVLALGGGGALYMKKKAATEEGEEEEVATSHAEHEGPPTYLPLDKMVVNLADPGGERVAQIGVTLELTDPKAPDRVKPYLPSIRNGILLLASQRTAAELLKIEGKEKLAEDILAEASKHFVDEPPPEEQKKKRKSKKKAKVQESPVRGVLFSDLIVQ